MSPEENTVVKMLEQKLDLLHEETKGQLDRIEIQVRSTNGRVTKLELREATEEAIQAEHRRMNRQWKETEDDRNRKKEVWTGIVPTVIASVVSGVIVAAAVLLF